MRMVDEEVCCDAVNMSLELSRMPERISWNMYD